MYRVKGDNNGTQMFEFMSQNTDVEWSQAKTGVEGYKGLNFITTSHGEKVEKGMADLYVSQLYNGYTIRELNHSHPNDTEYPSGSFIHPRNGKGIGEWGDIGFARDITNYQEKNGFKVPNFNIYLPGSGSYVKYNSGSIKSDYEK